jgi:uncharacterized protein YabN with tetrapyrrole methylase and pyrophosphatase domain
METLVEAEDLKLSEMSLSEMDVYWEKAKNILKKIQ